jgi:hypothetical protein
MKISNNSVGLFPPIWLVLTALSFVSYVGDLNVFKLMFQHLATRFQGTRSIADGIRLAMATLHDAIVWWQANGLAPVFNVVQKMTGFEVPHAWWSAISVVGFSFAFGVATAVRHRKNLIPAINQAKDAGADAVAAQEHLQLEHVKHMNELQAKIQVHMDEMAQLEATLSVNAKAFLSGEIEWEALSIPEQEEVLQHSDKLKEIQAKLKPLIGQLGSGMKRVEAAHIKADRATDRQLRATAVMIECYHYVQAGLRKAAWMALALAVISGVDFYYATRSAMM